MSSVTLSGLNENFSGQIILPTDGLYEQARSTFLHTGNPAVILQPQTTADIVMAIGYARDKALTLSVRSGGHSGAGFSTNDGGVVIDVSLLNEVKVIDQDQRLVRIGAGAKWGDVAKTLEPFGLAISSGDTKTVGVGGLTLGGGIGWMVRKYGLAIDNVEAAEVVTAQGEVLRASQTENADLFWAVRGGGGNFGVVTYFEFKAQPVKKVMAGAISYKLDDIKILLTGWRDHMRTASHDLSTMFLIMPAFGEAPPGVMVLCCYAGGDQVQAKTAIEPLLKLGTVIKNEVIEKNYADVLEDAHPPQGMKIVVNNSFVSSLTDELIAEIVKAHQQTPNFILQMRALGGAMNDIPVEATAFAHRHCEALLISPCFLPATAAVADVLKAIEYWQPIKAMSSGSYVNFFSEKEGEDITAAYPKATYERLARVKKTYDPHNLFNQNYNIEPEL